MGVMVFYVFAEQAGISLPTRPRNSLSYLLLYGFTFIAAGVVTWGSTRSFMRQIEALRDSEERFSALFRANPVPSSTIDRDGRTLDVNNAWVSLYGIAARDAMGKTAQEMGIWTNPDERKAVYLEMAHKGRVDGAPMTLRTAGGVLKPFLLYIAPVEFGGQQRLVTSVLDQSDRQAAEAAQRAINEALESRVAERTAELTRTVGTLQATQTELVEAAKLASLGAMVAGISHELNTPLGVAVTVASTVQDRIDVLRQAVTTDTLRRSTLGEFLDEQHEMAGLLLRSTERAAELVRSFKEVAVDRASERRRRFNLASLVQDILTSIQPGLGALHLALDLRVGTDIVCDSLPGPIGQVLTNLVQNAVVHAFAGRESGCISITADVQGSGASARVVLRIRDDGVGMSEYVRAHAFDPFFTTRLGQGGSGLGLSVSHRLANSMLGGSLAVESTPGAGTCFTFCFLQKLADAPAC